MKKLSIILLILNAFSISHANTAEISGTIKTGIEYEKTYHEPNGTTQIHDLGSSFTISGTENIYPNTDLQWRISPSINLVESTKKDNDFITNDSYIGLKGKFGQILLGYLSAPINHLSGGDPFEHYSNILTLGRFERFGDSATAITYESPEQWKSFNVAARFSPSKNAHHEDNNAHNHFLAGMRFSYTHDPSNLTFQYANDLEKHQDKKYTQVHQMLIEYSNDNLSLSAAAQYAKNVSNYFIDFDEDHQNTAHTRELALNIAYTKNSITPKMSLAYGHSSSGQQYHQTILGLDYNLSKHTYVIAGMGIVKDKGNPHQWALGLGLVHTIE